MSSSNPASGVRSDGEITTTSASRASRSSTGIESSLSEVERDAPFVGVVIGEREARFRTGGAPFDRTFAPHRITARQFDLHDVGAERGEQLRAVRGQLATEVDDAYAGQRLRRVAAIVFPHARSVPSTVRPVRSA